MAGIVKTWNHKNFNVNFNLTEITDLNGDVTITADSEFWEFVEGQNDTVERHLHGNNLLTATFPMMATSSQLDTFALADEADRRLGAGPFPFTAFNTDGNYKLIGTATVMSIERPTRAKTAPSRNVVLKIVATAEFNGL